MVEKAKRLGFEIRFIYVVLDSPDLNVARVAQRVAEGGHNVPRQKILDRYVSSLQNMPWFLNRSDRAWIFDNSGARPKLIALKQAGEIHVHSGAIPAIVTAIEEIRTS